MYIYTHSLCRYVYIHTHTCICKPVKLFCRAIQPSVRFALSFLPLEFVVARAVNRSFRESLSSKEPHHRLQARPDPTRLALLVSHGSQAPSHSSVLLLPTRTLWCSLHFPHLAAEDFIITALGRHQVAAGPTGSKGEGDKPWRLTAKSRTSPFTAVLLHSDASQNQLGWTLKPETSAQYKGHGVSGGGAQAAAWLEHFLGDPRAHSCWEVWVRKDQICRSGDWEPSHRGKGCAPGFSGPWTMRCSLSLFQLPSKCWFQSQTFRPFDNIADARSLVQKLSPQSYSFLSSFSSFQAQRSVLMAPQLQALAPRVALPCQVGKWHCIINLGTTGRRKDWFLRSWV